MKYPLVHIEFEDICTTPGWHQFPVTFSPTIATIVGYVVKKDRKHIILASGFVDDEYGDQTVLRRSLIVKMKVLRDADT